MLLGACLGRYNAPAKEQGLVSLIGAGTGSATIMCSACTHAGNMSGSTLTLQFAGAVGPRVRVGATVDGWAHSRQSWERDIANINALVFYYPGTMRRGFFVGAGPSYSLMYATVTDSSALQRHGWGVGAEMGYDIRPRSAVSLTPYLQYSYAWVGNIDYPLHTGIPFATGWKHQVVSVGLGLTWHQRKE